MDLLDLVRGCTFDDFLLTPQYGVLPRRDPDTVDLSARFTQHLTLKRPIVSANMDTVTRAAMAAVLAEEGGIGVIDRGFRAGDIGAGVTDLGQLFKRPTWQTYATPSKGLYLCSASTPPGVGVHGMCGYHAAKLALRQVLRD